MTTDNPRRLPDQNDPASWVEQTTTDPLAEFADRDRQVRDRISRIIHRGGTYPTPYPSHLAYLTDLVDAYTAKDDLTTQMLRVATVGGVLWNLLLDSGASTSLRLSEARQQLARSQQWAVDRDQRAAFATYAPNIEAVA